MSSTVGQVLQVYNQIWTLLEANADWAALVKPGNRIKYNISGQLARKSSKAPADLPEAILEIQGPIRDTLYTVGETFDMFKAGFSPAAGTWVEYLSITYLLTLTTRGTAVDDFDPLALLSLDAIRDGGPRLGLTFVRRVGEPNRGVNGNIQRTSGGDAGGTFRLVTKLQIPVRMQFDGHTLITPAP